MSPGCVSFAQLFLVYIGYRDAHSDSKDYTKFKKISIFEALWLCCMLSDFVRSSSDRPVWCFQSQTCCPRGNGQSGSCRVVPEASVDVDESVHVICKVAETSGDVRDVFPLPLYRCNLFS